MFCVINYGNNTSLWINDDCTDCEWRVGNYDLSKSTVLITKAITLNKINLDMCSNEYEVFYKDYYIKTKLRFNKRLLSTTIEFSIFDKKNDTINTIGRLCPTELLVFYYFRSDRDFYSNKIIQRILYRAFSDEYNLKLGMNWYEDFTFIGDLTC